MDGRRVERLCAKCGALVNVSNREKGGRKYVCPVCRGEPWYGTRQRLSEATNRSREAQRNWGKRRGDIGGRKMLCDVLQKTGGVVAGKPDGDPMLGEWPISWASDKPVSDRASHRG